MTNDLSLEEKEEYLKLLELKSRRTKLIDFTEYTFPNYKPAWFHYIFAQALEDILFTDLQNVIIEVPPQHGKSELASRRFPAFALGVNSSLKIISASYNADLASRMNRDVQRIIDSDEYRKIFGNTALANNAVRSNSSAVRNSEMFEVVDPRDGRATGGYYKSAGVGVGISGYPADLLIVDDPYKDSAEANSPTVRRNVWDWYVSAANARLRKKGKKIIVHTRWHEEDLIGTLLRMAKEDPRADQWKVISLPAIKEDESVEFDPRQPGEALWPEEMDVDTLYRRKLAMGTYAFNALYQQKPTAAEGNIIKREWIQYYDSPPSLDRFQKIIISCDLTFKGTNKNDYVVLQVWGLMGSGRYLLDQVRQRFSFTETLTAIKNLSLKWPQARAKLIEEKANGAAVIDSLKREIPGLIAINPKASKEERVYKVTPYFEARNIYLPSTRIANWIEDTVEEWVSFPNAKHDDTVDAMSQALDYLQVNNLILLRQKYG